jgi:hypothetical protein
MGARLAGDEDGVLGRQRDRRASRHELHQLGVQLLALGDDARICAGGPALVGGRHHQIDGGFLADDRGRLDQHVVGVVDDHLFPVSLALRQEQVDDETPFHQDVARQERQVTLDFDGVEGVVVELKQLFVFDPTQDDRAEGNLPVEIDGGACHGVSQVDEPHDAIHRASVAGDPVVGDRPAL